MSNTKTGENRAFGFAGKLFPTTNPSKLNSENSANFFLIDDLGGTDAANYTDVEMINEPNVSFTLGVAKHIFYALRVSYIFAKADKNPGIRQLYEISYLGENKNKSVVTPKWMKIETADSSKKEGDDFRDELKIKDGEKLIFNIFVSSKIRDEKKDWKRVGTITLDKSIISKSCDSRLHFHHPVWRDNLDYGDD